MKEEQLRNKMFLMQALDWTLFLSVAAFGTYAFFYSEIKPLMAIMTLLGMVAVHYIGDFLLERVAIMRVEQSVYRRQRAAWRDRMVKKT